STLCARIGVRLWHWAESQVSEQLQALPVHIVHHDERSAIVGHRVAGTDELLVAAEVCKRDLPRRQQLEETARAAAMLHVGPARLADGRQVETVGRRKEFGLVWTKPAAGLGFRLHARVL